MKNFWNAEVYSQFIVARTRPAHDLLQAIPDTLTPSLIYDLGCGPGNSTNLLKKRWPNASLVGIDSSQDMLALAQADYPDMNFIKANIAQFSTPEKIDLIFTNAALQWVDDHHQVIPKLANHLNNNGMLAIQMPNNFHCPSHQITIQILQSHPSWQSLLKNLRYGVLNEPMYKVDYYYNLFIQSGLENLILWETEYFLEMPNHQAIYQWVSGTGLRPILSHLNEIDKPNFIEEYIQHITRTYPMQSNNKVLFPFRRIFMVGSKIKN